MGPGSSESESSEIDSEDSDSSEPESGDSDPFNMEARRRGPLTSSSSDSDSSAASSDSEESDSSSADSGFAKPSSSDTEVDFTPSAPSLEETEEFGRKVTRLSGGARWQVRKLLAVLTRMRKSLPPSASIEAVKDWVGVWDPELRPAGPSGKGLILNLRECRKVASNKEVSGGMAAEV